MEGAGAHGGVRGHLVQAVCGRGEDRGEPVGQGAGARDGELGAGHQTFLAAVVRHTAHSPRVREVVHMTESRAAITRQLALCAMAGG
ncbi:hypothetical protein SMICM304S_08469 [Streptomyces microflavus]